MSKCNSCDDHLPPGWYGHCSRCLEEIEGQPVEWQGKLISTLATLTLLIATVCVMFNHHYWTLWLQSAALCVYCVAMSQETR
jgi:hypothetical protein